MREGYLRPRHDLPRINQRIPSIHRHKLSLDISLITAPNVSDFSFPSQRTHNDSYISKSKKQITPGGISFLNNQVFSKSYKKYIPGTVKSYPVNGMEAIKTMNDSLSEYELRELPSFAEVFFIGDYKSKIHGSLRDLNWGYDDEEANYKIVPGDHIFYRYEILSILGKGSFGQVCRCLDHKTSDIVALKILKNKSKFHKQGEVEVKLLRTLNHHDPNDNCHVVRMHASFTFRCHLCIVFELLHVSLYDFLKKNHYRGFSMTVIKEIAVQLLVSLRFIKEHTVIHCDLKPENILFVSPNNIRIKIIDFGSGCFEKKQIYTYIQSRFYRSPEIMLGISYTPAIDMWSLGCIMVELFRGYPLFPGKNEEDQMSKILEVVGLPPKGFLAKASRKLNFFDKFGIPLPVFDSKGRLRVPASNPIEDILGQSNEFCHFVKDCLKWDPDERITPENALKHPWIINDSL